MKKSKRNPLELRLEAFTQQTINNVFESLDKEAEMFGEDYAEAASMGILAKFTGVLILKALSKKLKRKKSSKEAQYNFAERNYTFTKSAIEASVSMAFQGAMTQWTGHNIGYYCQVKPIPEPVNKEMC